MKKHIKSQTRILLVVSLMILSASCEDFIFELELYPAQEEASYYLFELIRKVNQLQDKSLQQQLSKEFENRITGLEIHSKYKKALSSQLQRLKETIN